MDLDDFASSWNTQLQFYLNGKRVCIPSNVPADMTLLQWLRSNGHTGTKLGCGEGGCGACTVMISHYDVERKKIIHRAINACLAPLCSVDGCAVVTIEGIGSSKTLHSVQERIAGFHGSQCGFCTPGIVMALYAFLRSNPNATMAQIEDSFDGNLCRCTGYRSILDGAKTFGSDYDPKSPSKSPTGQRLCPGTGMPCYCARVPDTHEHGETKIKFDHNGTEPIFPPALKSYHAEPLRLTDAQQTSVWYRPTNLEDLLRLKRHNEARIVVGATEVSVEVYLKRGKQPYKIMISPSHVTEMNAIKVLDTGITFGAAVSLSRVSEFLKEQIAVLPAEKTENFKAVVEQLKWFAGHQIRNAACLGGNIATASPISDINPVLVAAGAELTVASMEHGSKVVPMDRSFFKGYRMTALHPHEVIVSVHIPFTEADEFVVAYKQARRKDDDIAICSGCFRGKFTKDDKGFKVERIRLVYGGMAAWTKMASEDVEKSLVGQSWNEETLEKTYQKLSAEFTLDPHAPGGMIDYRRTLVLSFLYKYFLHVQHRLGASIPERYLSAIEEHERPVSSGYQSWPEFPDKAPVGAPVQHQSAFKQVTGEAVYLDDMPQQPGELFAAFVFSQKPHAKIKSINPARALAHEGVVAFYDAKSIPGHNNIGPVWMDEELFASEEVLCVGYPVGIVVAHNQRSAQQGASLVNVEYEELDWCVTIHDAIAKNSFFPENHELHRGDVDAAWSTCDHIVEGEFEMGGQEHFYFETNASLAVPGEDDEMVVYASTQNPSKTQMKVASCLHVPANRVVCKVKRMGGGFGGKETRSLYVSCAAAVGAYHTKKPVRMVLDREEDMMSSGTRHPFYFKYKAGVSKDGKIIAMDVLLYSNAGCTIDLSGAVMDRALFHVDNAYFIPNLRCKGHLCKTNIPSNTAFRGFGAPQGMMFTENLINHISHTTGIHANKIRELNMYQEGQQTHYLQTVSNNTMPRLWKHLMDVSDFSTREAAVKEFNKINRFKKRGIACVPVKFGMSFTLAFMNQAGALVHCYPDGTILISHAGTEMGQGLHTKLIQIAAKELNVPVSQVYIAETSTDKVANTSPTAASVQSDLNGMAVLDACKQINARLKPLRDAHPDFSFQKLAQKAIFERIDLTAHGYYATPDVGYDFSKKAGKPFHYYTFGASCSEVEIDTLTGEMHVIRSDCVMDVGESLNPAIDIGQIEGAFVQGLGLTTLEEIVIDDKWTRSPGKIFTRGPGTYKIPGFKNVPLNLNIHLLPGSANPLAVHGSKGIGEPPLFMGASVYFAVREAVTDARSEVGMNDFFRMNSPATCERIRMSCPDQLSGKIVNKK